MTSARSSLESFVGRIVLILCIGIALFAAIIPIASTFFRVELSYNEGWNIYNAVTLANHGVLYPLREGWTTVNYPMGWYVLLDALHTVTHDYWFTGRVVTLLSFFAVCILVAAILRRLGVPLRPAWIAALFCFGTFCATSTDIFVHTQYINANDPQIFSIMLFCLGTWIYFVACDRALDPRLLALAALVFVAGASVKQNTVALAITVWLDLLYRSRAKTLFFTVCLAIFAAISLALHIHFGGPGFIHAILLPRVFPHGKVWFTFHLAFGTLLIPLAIAAVTAVLELLKPTASRFVVIYFALSVTIGLIFARAQGVSVNCFFEAVIAMTMLIGLLLARLESSGAYALGHTITLAVFALLFIPICRGDILDPIGRLHDLQHSQHEFDEEMIVMRPAPGAALCESLLRCYAAQKSYLYDPFNATRLIYINAIPVAPLNEAITMKRFSIIELQAPAEEAISIHSERFPPSSLLAIQQHYRLVMHRTDANIYVPR
ncbi:hypothetical protein ACFQBQ_02815 [Granulicella cerasi]|uniref:Glycosyltransferase RgtA/B/C/D-like domain-containing protein n=1 Tax=Granulicella cerasi TaxID=741063 RepID=A0ABW1Z5D2_9BACT|nr:hypothetical protein [Granulicella cerasi]